MNQFQDVVRCLLTAGYANHPEGQGVYLLYVDSESSSLICKHWTGQSFGHEELVAAAVRPNSVASYLINPVTQLVVCVSPESTIQVLQYDDDVEEWVGVPERQRHVVHPEGKLAACFGVDKIKRVFYQDPSERLVYLNEAFQPTLLPAKPAKGSPISCAVIDGRIYAFYISASDKYMHYVTETHSGSWTDGVLANCTFEQSPKQFMVLANMPFEVYAITEGNNFLRIADNKMSILGEVDGKGRFVSARSVDRCCKDAWKGTLTADRLKEYIAHDREIIDTPGGEHSVTPLAAACWRGHLDTVKLLLHEGADPNALSTSNRTPLYYLTNRSPDRHRLEILRALLDAGANIDECYPENYLNTPLMSAIAVVADKGVVQELLKRGASLTATNAQGQTAKEMVQGTKMEADFQKWTTNELETRLVEFLVSFLVLVITYFNNDFIRNVFSEVAMEVTSRLEEMEDN